MMEPPVIAENLEIKQTAPTKVNRLDGILWTSEERDPGNEYYPQVITGSHQLPDFLIPPN